MKNRFFYSLLVLAFIILFQGCGDEAGDSAGGGDSATSAGTPSAGVSSSDGTSERVIPTKNPHLTRLTKAQIADRVATAKESDAYKNRIDECLDCVVAAERGALNVKYIDGLVEHCVNKPKKE